MGLVAFAGSFLLPGRLIGPLSLRILFCADSRLAVREALSLAPRSGEREG
jgi:hypothetical protein